MRKSATNRPDNINHKLTKTIELAQVFQASLFKMDQPWGLTFEELIYTLTPPPALADAGPAPA